MTNNIVMSSCSHLQRAYILHLVSGILLLGHSCIYAPLKFLSLLKKNLLQCCTYRNRDKNFCVIYLHYELCRISKYANCEISRTSILIQLGLEKISLPYTC